MVPHGAQEAVKYVSELTATFLGIAEAGDVRLGRIIAHWKAEIKPVPAVSLKFRRSLYSISGAQKRHGRAPLAYSEHIIWRRDVDIICRRTIPCILSATML
jgi:hypothetical protein